MSAYHQVGDRYDNILSEISLLKYRGAVLSPVNYSPDETADLVRRIQRTNFEMVFDPQLYFPESEREKLRKWDYFPLDVDTADVSDSAWWQQIINGISATVSQLNATGVCSPAVVPGSYSPDYYELSRSIAEDLAATITASTTVLQTLIVNMSDVAESGRSEEIASIATESDLSRAYLVLVPSKAPDQEYSRGSELKGVMRLIQLLEANDVRVLVGFTSADMLLWKVAGATSCATGKHTGSRRFSSRRWDRPPRGGGGQTSTWFEESILTFINEADVIRLNEADQLSQASLRNPFGRTILKIIEAESGASWMSEGWKQYLYWFMDCEERLGNDAGLGRQMVQAAQRMWGQVNESGGLIGKAAVKGDWLQAWNEALT